ncbi:unnamed protein product [Amoebophrya sp. A25]|nr:unnamed protein product [Amoebophrya sp. A25]|eukprot:GSA25T00022746001.1
MVCAGKTPETQAICSGLHFSETDCEGDHFCQWIVKPSVAKHCINKTRCVDYDTKAACLYHLNEPNLEGSADNSAQRSCAWTEKLERSKICRSKSVLYPNPACAQQTSEKSCLQGDDCEWLSNPKPEFECQPRAFACHDHKSQTECMTIGDTAPLRSSKTSREDADGDHNKIEDGDHTKNDSGGQNAGGDTVSTSEDNNRNPGSCIWTRPPVPSACVDREHPENASSVCRQYTSAASCRKQNLKENQVVDQMKGNASCVWSQLPSLQRQNACYTKKEVGDYEKCQSHYLQHLRKENQDLKDEPKLQVDEAKIVPDEAAEHLVNPSACTQEKGVCHFVPNPATHVCIGDSVKDDVHCMQFDAQKESCRADGLCIWWKVTTDEKGSEIMKARTKAKIQLQNTNRMRRETEKLFLGVKDARARGMEFVASGVENSTDALGAGGVNKQGLTDGAQKLVPKNDDAATTALQGFKNMLSGGGISSSALELHPTIKTSAGGSSSSYNNDNIMTNTTRGATTRNVHHSSSRGATTTMFADTSTSEGADVGENGANLNEDGAEQGASSASSSADVQDTVTGEAVVEDASIILHPAEVEAPLPHQEHSPTAVRPGGRCLLVNPELMREADKDGAGLDAPCNTRRVRRSQQQDTAEQAKEVVDQAPDGAAHTAEGSEVPRSTEGATEEIDPPLTREGCEDGSDGLVSSSHGGHFSTPPGGAVVPGSSNCRWFRAIPTDKGNGVELLKAWVSEEVVRFRTSQKARIKSIFETNALSGELYPASDGTERHLKATAREWLAEAASVTDDMVTQVANKLRKRIDYFVDAKNEVEGAAGTVFTRQQLFREVQDDVARELFHAERMAQQRVTEVQRAMEEYAHLSFTRLPMESGTSSQRLARRQRRNVVANSRWLDPFVFFTKQQQGSSIGNNKDIRVHPSEDSRTGVSTSMKTASFVEDRGRGRSASFARSQEAQRRHQHVKSLMRKLGTSDLVLYQQKTGSLSGDTSKNAGSSRNNHSGGTKKITTTTLSPAGEWVKKMLFSSEDGQEEDAQHDSQGGDHILSATTSSSSTSFGKKDTKNYMDAASSFAEEGKDQDEGHSEEHSEEREQEENQVEKPPEVEVEPSDFFFTNHVHKPKDIDGSRESRWNLAFPHIMKLIGKRNLGIENTTVTLDDETADATSMMIRSIESKVAEVNESINGPKIATPDLAVLHPALKSLIPNLPVPGSESDMRLRDYVGAILKTVTSEETWSPMKEFVSNAFGVAKDAGGVVADVGSDVGEVAADVRKVAGDVGNKVAGDVGKVAGDVGIAAAGAAVDTARVTANVASPMTMLAADFLTLYKDFHRTAGNALKENLSEMPTFWEIQNREPRKMRSDSRILSEMQRLAYSRMRNMSLDNAVSGTSYDDAERPVGPAMSALHQAFFLKFGQTTPGYEGHTLSEMKTDKKLRKVCINHGLSGVKTKCALPVHGEGQKIARLPIPASVLPESWSPLEQREHAVKCARSHGCAPGCMGCQDRVFDAGTAKYLGEVNPYRPADAFQHRDNPGSNSFVSSSIDREKAYEEFLAVEGERIRQGMEASLVPRINMDDTTADFAPDTVLAVA